VEGAAVTTGKKFQYGGHGPSARIERLHKEIDLIDLETRGHREMVSKLRYVQDFVLLTCEQAREVAGEFRWRQETLRRLTNVRHNKVIAARGWSAKLAEARMRTTEVTT
jgi:hypothetical protein